QVHAIHFPILSHIARDVLAIPDVSIQHCSGAPLLKQQKHSIRFPVFYGCSDCVSATIVATELLKAGFGEGLNYLEGITIH
ncbi:hypothetical protein DFH08DRAFT_706714, partial [Mycena albidolilacea]